MPRIVGIALVLASLLVACGGETAYAPAREPAPSPLPTPRGDEDPELAGRLPTEIGGQELEVQSFCVTSVSPGGINLSSAFLEDAGVELSDVTMAVAQPAEVGGDTTFVSVSAFRYRGSDEATLQSAVLDTLDEAEIPYEAETIADGDAYRVLGAAVWYIADDTLYLITGEDPQVEEVLQALP